MAITPEKKVKNEVVKILKENNVYYFFPGTHGYGRSGVPDIVCCVDGKFMAIECKAKRNNLTTLQENGIKNIQAASGIALVVNETNMDLVRGAIKLIKELSN
jgi:Holliday junction resolvase